ncbi:hypothetical protein BDY21DRAFT_291255 [Lineolata rhizophorae]|uniref:Uncharacterized protein n=1 Tax=Lineolata rhizophorae TaxID=578093 RepID=A0A6A6NRW0_9PEZI|nr:hypothetical protein BDY21DRAFT_291255 [Lineolata rhizophorae]
MAAAGGAASGGAGSGGGAGGGAGSGVAASPGARPRSSGGEAHALAYRPSRRRRDSFPVGGAGGAGGGGKGPREHQGAGGGAAAAGAVAAGPGAASAGLVSRSPGSGGGSTATLTPGSRPASSSTCRRGSGAAWPPRGFQYQSVLTPREADDTVCRGASTFKGYKDAVANSQGHWHFFAVMETDSAQRADRAEPRHPAFRDVSLTVTGPEDSAFPWVSLEQPSMAFCFGATPGTVTLNYRVGKSGNLHPGVQYGSKVRPKKAKLFDVLDRLRRLERGLDDEDPKLLYRYLYSTLIDDPDAHTNPHYAMELQIADLITVLSHPDWIDFSHPRNQVVAKFFDSPSNSKRELFFHQLLLSVELYLRIHSEEHLETPKRKLLKQLPPKIAWDLALAQRWLDHMSISKPRSTSSKHKSKFTFDFRSKGRQKEALRVFAKTLKWPNMDEILYVLEERDASETPVEDRSPASMSWFMGVVLPGVTLPWLVMTALIDCDRDTDGKLPPDALSHSHPASGFQYRNTTYWSYRCIVGKVLGAARGVNQVAGWIGPCSFSPDLHRVEAVRIRQATPPGEPRLMPQDVETMARRTEPLGPANNEYPIADYDLLLPDEEEAATDDIRVEKLSLKPVKDQPATAAGGRRAGNSPGNGTLLSPNCPLVWDAAISFACGGRSWMLSLRYDVDFIAAFPCHAGPHVLFYDYAYRAVKEDGFDEDDEDEDGEDDFDLDEDDEDEDEDDEVGADGAPRPAFERIEQVLAIEALGVSDNEVLARAWCAHWGLSAVVANVTRTCMACAIREAYAACVGVVIFTRGGREGEVG